MASSTTLKIPEELKRRVTEAAAAAGKSPHAFMVEAIDLQTQFAERRREFVGRRLPPSRRWRSTAWCTTATRS